MNVDGRSVGESYHPVIFFSVVNNVSETLVGKRLVDVIK